MLTRHDLRIDVSGAVGIPGAQIAATVIAPSIVAEKPLVAEGFPGGGYARGYWDIQWPGRYSQAEYHARRGWTFVAVDHLGVGDSSLPDPTMLTFEALAAANSAATQRIVSMLRSGTLSVNGVAPVQSPYVIGLGQSMGGCVSIVAQAAHRTFDALAVLGYSASHTVLASPEGGVRVTPVARGRTDDDALRSEAAEVGDVDVFA
jgi:pimeloyl-ACP methyl ester carboxylesterase